MNLNKIAIVLLNPEESRNVGAVCRAMANNALSDLRIVGSKENFDDEHVRRLAIHAADIWENAKFFNSITEAKKTARFPQAQHADEGKNAKTNFCSRKNLQNSLRTFQEQKQAKVRLSQQFLEMSVQDFPTKSFQNVQSELQFLLRQDLLLSTFRTQFKLLHITFLERRQK